ncbi:SMP-30/gluconolactonase/LRE family protein [Ideonella sp. BN130291]|uniref:SMP-30/gluconolactonase/LRE family protein n=1 Tax=Ideonella sp. BN130291 TaxID=3112940 RepID=UPI002E255407|nr:SMP-30/gluconolactonase/LRE family protein [Ideonella sp. BN130291]
MPPAPLPLAHLADTIDACDRRFAELVRLDATVQRLHGGCEWAEGPVWFAETATLLWSDIPNNRILQWHEADGVKVFRAPSDFANGHTRDRSGRLVSCEHGTRSVTRTEPDGRRTVLADRFGGHRLNSPNDVVVSADGSIWFTDPSYGIDNPREGLPGQREYGGCHVFRLPAGGGQLQVVADDFVQPNGLAFSADERTLYVVDTGGTHVPGGPRHIRVLRLDDQGQVQHSRVFAQIDGGFPDGLALDAFGHVWASAGNGVQCFAADGSLLGRLKLPEPAANLCFGGADRRRLFITASRSLYAVDLLVRGLN